MTQVDFDSVDYVKEAARPRVIKTHVCIELLPDQIWKKNPTIVYVTRNPKDAAVSFYHHQRNMLGYRETKELFMDAYLKDEVTFGPFFDHVLNYWSIRHRPNVLFLTYEEMKKDLLSVLRRVSKFLGKTYHEDQLKKLADHVSFENMKSK